MPAPEPAGTADPQEAEGLLLLAEAEDLYDAGDLPGCEQAVQRALLWARARARPDIAARAHLVGALHDVDGLAYESAARHVGAVQVLARELGSRELLARGHVAASRLYVALGDFDQSTQELDAARPLVPETGLVAFEFLEGVVNTQASLGQIDHALATLDQLAPVVAALGLPRLQARVLGSRAGRLLSKGWALLEAGQRDAGRATLEQSVALGRQALRDNTQAGAARQNLSVLNNLAAAWAWLGRLDEALATYAQYRELARALGHETVQANVALGEARVLRQLGQPAAARALALQGLALADRLHAGRIGAWLHRLVSELDEEAGDLASALAHFKQHHELLLRVDSEAAQRHSRVLAVRLEAERAQREAQAEHERNEALRRANRALELRAEILSREAMQDALTGLANRRRIDLQLAAVPHPPASEPAGCVALLDVDHFKLINDRHSHAVGDLVLVQLAALITHQCREGDLPARWGGEEFLVSFPHLGLAQAAAVCERLRATVATHDWSAIAPGLAVTVSIGVVDLGHHAGLADALAAADERMYRAKHGGRNRVCADDGCRSPGADC